MADVEQAAAVGRSQLYHYFEDRDELLRAVAEANAQDLATRATALLEDVRTVPDLDRWFGAMIAASTATAGRYGCPLGSLAHQLPLTDQRNHTTVAGGFDAWEAPLVSALRRLQDSGALRVDAGAMELADQVMCLVQGGLLLAQVREDPGQLRLALAAARSLLAAAVPPARRRTK